MLNRVGLTIAIATRAGSITPVQASSESIVLLQFDWYLIPAPDCPCPTFIESSSTAHAISLRTGLNCIGIGSLCDDLDTSGLILGAGSLAHAICDDAEAITGCSAVCWPSSFISTTLYKRVFTSDCTLDQQTTLIAFAQANSHVVIDISSCGSATLRRKLTFLAEPCSHSTGGVWLGTINRTLILSGSTVPFAVTTDGTCEHLRNVTDDDSCVFAGNVDTAVGPGVVTIDSQPTPITFNDSRLDANSDGRFNQLDVDGPSGVLTMIGTMNTSLIERFDLTGDGAITLADVDAPQAIVDAGLDSGVFGDVSGDGSVTCTDLVGAQSYPVAPATVGFCDPAYDIRLDYNLDGVLDATDAAAFATLTANILDPDFNHDGVLDFTDFDDFVTAFETGC